MRKLIIGCGYVGRRVAQLWRTQSHSVVALTRREANASALNALGVETVLGDVTQPQTLGKLPQADTVLFAVGYDRTARPSMHDVYVEGLRNVLERIAGNTGQFVYLSSTSVYGQSHGEVVDEASPCLPTRENGQVCLEAEELLPKFFGNAANPQTRRSANILRLAGIYGPGRLLSRVQSLKAGTPLKGSPRAWLNLIHVDDAAAAVLACEQRGQPGRNYVVCDDRPLHRKEYYERLARAVSAPNPRFEPADETTELPLNKRCNNHRLRAELKVELQFPDVETGLADAIARSEGL